MKAVLFVVMVTITTVVSRPGQRFNGDPLKEYYESPSFSYGYAYPNITYQSQSWLSYPYGRVHLISAYYPVKAPPLATAEKADTKKN